MDARVDVSPFSFSTHPDRYRHWKLELLGGGLARLTMAVREDQLVPLGDMRAMVARLPNAELHEISSVYGHDAFLKENRQLKPIFTHVLNDLPGPTP